MMPPCRASDFATEGASAKHTRVTAKMEKKEGRQKTKFCSQVGPLNTVYGSAMNESYAKPEQM
jgi:hypothetical protein